jgi:hypothetical protein
MASDFMHKINMMGMAQENFATCWYSSYKMALEAAGKGALDVDALLSAAAIDVPDAKEKGLKDTDYSKAARALGFNQFSGTDYNKKPDFLDFGLSDYAEKFIDQLQKGPIWVSRAGTTSKHIIVAYGYSSSGDKIWFANPWAPGATDANQKWMEANDFVFKITGDSAAVQQHSKY